MPLRITDATKDVSILNRALRQLEAAQKDIINLQARQATVEKTAQNLVTAISGPFQDNSVFVWTGGTLTISWVAFYLKNTAAQQFSQVAAGSRTGLLASTYYWLGWSPSQQIMSFEVSKDALANIANLTIIAQIYTGTAGQSGNAGGGGTTPGGSADTGLAYKLF